jgi:hypothetical protein
MRGSLSISSFSRWLLGTVLVTVILVSLFVASSEYMIRKYIEAEHTFDAHVRYVYRTQSVNAIFGDSFAAYAFHGQPSFAKLAMQAEKPNLMLAKARAYFRDRDPGKVIVEAGIALFKTADHGDPDNDYRYPEIFGVGELGWLRVLRPHHRMSLRRYWMTLAAKGGFKSDRYIDENGQLIFHRFNDIYANGTEDYRRARARAYAQEIIEPLRIEGNRNMEYYRELIRFLKQRGANVCLAVFPVSQSFLEVVGANEKYQTLIDYYKELARGEGMTFVDLTGSISDNSYYWNGTHAHQSVAPKIADAIVDRCYN